MIQDTLAQIEAQLQKASSVPEDNRGHLLELLGQLRAEIEQVSQTHGEQAQSIAGFTGLSAHEATRREKNPALLQAALAGLSSSVEGFEHSHPRLVDSVNRIAVALSNLGI